MALASKRKDPMVATFSIVAYDEEEEAWGVAVQSKFLAVGAVVPWAKAKAGAVATQSRANTTYGPRGLQQMGEGRTALEVVQTLTEEDEKRDLRQVAMVDARGRAAAFTGEDCIDWAGHQVGENYSCQGNILAGPPVLEKMAEAFETSDDNFPERLISALQAGQAAGGDRRGRQSAALLVVKESGGYQGFDDRYIDLRVDDHPRPINELERILDLHRLYFSRPEDRDLVPLEGGVLREVKEYLQEMGYYPGTSAAELDDLTQNALEHFHAVENLEEKLAERGYIDKRVLEFMRHKMAGE